MVVGIVLAALLIAFIVACRVIFEKAFVVTPKHTGGARDPQKSSQYPAHRDQLLALVDAVLARPYEALAIQSCDGLRLFAKYYHARDGAPLQILFHGYRGVAERDLCGGMKCAFDQGFNLLLVDQRAHGRSEGRCLTLGVMERRDCASWVKYACDRFGADTRIVLSGVSMGAATVLMAAGLDLPDSVVGVIADCGYTSPEAIIKSVIRRMRLPVFPTYALCRAGARLYGHFDPSSCSALEAMRRCRVPVLFIHGDRDHFVPFEMSLENFAACAAEKRLLRVPGAGHAMGYVTDTRAYEAATRDFTDFILKGADRPSV